MMAGTVIVIPCYNEAARLSVDAFHTFLRQFPECRFCFVNDGSRDDTPSLLDEFAKDYPQTTVYHLEGNRGKAEAIRYCVLQLISTSQSRYIGYWDADLSTPLDEIPRFLEVLQTNPHLSLVVGSRIQLMGRRIQRHWYRHYAGRVFATFASLILRLPIYDTQCGAKLLRTELAEEVFRRPFLSAWLFDIELIARMNVALGRERVREAIFELPLNTWHDVAGSKLTILDFVKAPIQLLRIFFHYESRSR